LDCYDSVNAGLVFPLGTKPRLKIIIENNPKIPVKKITTCISYPGNQYYKETKPCTSSNIPYSNLIGYQELCIIPNFNSWRTGLETFKIFFNGQLVLKKSINFVNKN